MSKLSGLSAAKRRRIDLPVAASDLQSDDGDSNEPGPSRIDRFERDIEDATVSEDDEEVIIDDEEASEDDHDISSFLREESSSSDDEDSG